MEHYMDEKWQVWRDDNGCNGSSSSKTPAALSSRSMSQRSSAMSPLRRSSSEKSNCVRSSSLTRSSSQKCVEFTRKCSSLAKEQRARFYIVKRCISMLVRWKKNADS